MSTIRKGDVVKAAEEYHVTLVSGDDVYGHATQFCDESGCAGNEIYLGTSDELEHVEPQPMEDES